MELISLKANIDELTAEVNSLATLPVSSLSKSSLAKVSLDLRDIAKRLTIESQKNENVNSPELAAIQTTFKALVETVQVLLRDLQVHRKSSLLLITGADSISEGASYRRSMDENGPEETRKPLKKPKPLKGTLKKLGEKGLIKTWKTRHFSQAGTRLNYFENELDLSPRSFIPLNEVTKVVRKEKLVFEMHTPHRVYILQALDELDLEEWLIRTNDWIDYFAQVDKQRTAEPADWQSTQKPSEEERYRLLQATVANQEVQNEILEQQISEVKRQIEASQQAQQLRRTEMEEKLRTEIESKKKNIDNLLSEMRQQNEHLDREESKSDKIRVSIAESQFQTILKEAELQRLDLVIRELEEQQAAQEESINSLEEAIEEERRKGNKQSPQKPSRSLQPVMKSVQDQRKINHQIQTTNAALAKEISDIEREIRFQEEATDAFARVLSERIARYETEYRALSKALVEGQGEDMSLLIQRDRLKDLYFNALVIQMKLQFQSLGQYAQVDGASLYQNVEMVDYASWPKLVESALLHESNPKAKSDAQGKRKTAPSLND